MGHRASQADPAGKAAGGATAGIIDASPAPFFNSCMADENHSRTDAELAGMLDEPGGWMVRAEASAAIPQTQLRAALFQAFELSAAGLRVTQIVKAPDDAVALDVMQIHRLWWRLGLLGGLSSRLARLGSGRGLEIDQRRNCSTKLCLASQIPGSLLEGGGWDATACT